MFLHKHILSIFWGWICEKLKPQIEKHNAYKKTCIYLQFLDLEFKEFINGWVKIRSWEIKKIDNNQYAYLDRFILELKVYSGMI